MSRPDYLSQPQVFHTGIEASPRDDSCLTAREAAELAGVHERTIRRAISRGELAATRQRGRFCIAPEALTTYLERARAGSIPSRPSWLHTPAVDVPAPPTEIIGRTDEVHQVRELLLAPDGRLTSLTGPGGVGKTRLALAVANTVAPKMSEGALFIPLDAVHDPEQVAATIAQHLGVALSVARPAREILAEAVRDRQQLIILDNFEHLLPAATVVAGLLAAGPELRLLVTSREALHVRGEVEIVVAPLAVPDPARSDMPGEISGVPAVELFLRRARAALPGFELTNENAATIAAICRNLDGLPLAIELAAAQIKHYSPDALMSRLARRLDTLTNGARDLPDRLQTMRAAIAWSYDLLTPAEQKDFRRLAVFAGGFTPDTAAAVLRGADREAVTTSRGAGDALPRLHALVDQSLLHQQPGTMEIRYTMLETIREFAQEKLAASDEGPAVARQHALTFLAVAKAAAPLWHGPAEAEGLTRLETELGNFRAALSWAVHDTEDADLALQLANGLFWLWYVHGYHREGWNWFDMLLARPDAEQAAEPYADARIHAGWLALRMGKGQQALDLLSTALPRCQDLHLPRSTCFARGSSGFARLVVAGDVTGAVHLFEVARSEARTLGDSWLEAMFAYGLGIAALASGDPATAQHHCAESLATSRRSGDAQGVAASLAILGLLARARGATREALGIFADALANFQRVGDRGNICTCVESLAGLLVEIGHPQQGVLMLASASVVRLRSGTPVPADEQPRYTADLARAHAALPEAEFHAIWNAGETTPLQEVLAGFTAEQFDLSPEQRDQMPAVGSKGATRLTRREREVLELVSAGHTDRQIGHLLSISPDTVTKHIGNILSKLGVRSRTAAAIHFFTTRTT